MTSLFGAPPPYDPNQTLAAIMRDIGLVPTDMSDQRHWDKLYRDDIKTGSTVDRDCYTTLDVLWQFIEPYLSTERNDEILVVGCGSSTFSVGMFKRGFKNITNVDTCRQLIMYLRIKHRPLQGMRYVCQDARQMDMFPGELFRFVFDKGTVDCMFGSVTAVEEVRNMLTEISRVLKPGGYFLMVSYAPPHARKGWLIDAAYDWSVDSGQIPGDTGTPPHYIYYMQKHLPVVETLNDALDLGALRAARAAGIDLLEDAGGGSGVVARH